MTGDAVVALWAARDERYSWWRRRLNQGEIRQVLIARHWDIEHRAVESDRARLRTTLQEWRPPTLIVRVAPSLVAR